MEIDKLVSLVTKQVKERLDAFENRKKVLFLGDCENACMEKLCNAFESSGFMTCDVEMYKKDQDMDDYEFIVISKSKFRDMLLKVNQEVDAVKAEGTEADQPAASCRIDKRIVTEQDIQKLIREGCREMKVGRKTIITPLALDSLKVGSIRVVKE